MDSMNWFMIGGAALGALAARKFGGKRSQGVKLLAGMAAGAFVAHKAVLSRTGGYYTRVREDGLPMRMMTGQEFGSYWQERLAAHPGELPQYQAALATRNRIALRKG